MQTEARYHSATKTSDQVTKQQLPDGWELASYTHSVVQCLFRTKIREQNIYVCVAC